MIPQTRRILRCDHDCHASQSAVKVDKAAYESGVDLTVAIDKRLTDIARAGNDHRIDRTNPV